MGVMTTSPQLSAPRRWISIVVVWLAAAVCSVVIGIASPRVHDAPWLSLTLGGCVVAALCVQLATQEKRGFVSRLTASILGAVVVLAIASIVLLLLGR